MSVINRCFVPISFRVMLLHIITHFYVSRFKSQDDFKKEVVGTEDFLNEVTNVAVCIMTYDDKPSHEANNDLLQIISP